MKLFYLPGMVPFIALKVFYFQDGRQTQTQTRGGGDGGDGGVVVHFEGKAHLRAKVPFHHCD